MGCHITIETPRVQKPISEVHAMIRGLDLSRKRDLLAEREGISKEEATRWTELFRKTLCLFVSFSGNLLWIHKEADEVLHLFMLDTREYPQFCDKVFGSFLDHKLRLSTDPLPEPAETTVGRTAEFWRELFGEDFSQQGIVWH